MFGSGLTVGARKFTDWTFRVIGRISVVLSSLGMMVAVLLKQYDPVGSFVRTIVITGPAEEYLFLREVAGTDDGSPVFQA
jgi:hypothetical protein